MIEIGRIMLAILLVTILITSYFSFSVAFLITVIAMASEIFVFNKKLQSFYERMERNFLTSLNERESLNIKQEITPWDAHLATFDVLPDFQLSGKQLFELQLREIYGVNIALIERGKSFIISPDRYEKLYPGDKLSIIGTDDQLAAARELFESRRQTRRSSPPGGDNTAKLYSYIRIKIVESNDSQIGNTRPGKSFSRGT